MLSNAVAIQAYFFWTIQLKRHIRKSIYLNEKTLKASAKN